MLAYDTLVDIAPVEAILAHTLWSRRAGAVCPITFSLDH
jgi:hypothetical protein